MTDISPLKDHAKRQMSFSYVMGLLLVLVFGLSVNASAAKFELQLGSNSQLDKARESLLDGDAKNARKMYLTALRNETSERHIALIHNDLCVTYIMDETWGKAMTHCDSAIRIRGSNWRFYNNRANIFLQTGKLRKALQDYRKAESLGSKSWILQKNIAIAEMRIAMENNNRSNQIDLDNDPVKNDYDNLTLS